MISNVVDKKTLRNKQLETLDFLKEVLLKSFGPFGSNTIIDGGKNALPRYTKDGHTILKSLQFSGPIESSVASDIEAETRNQAVKVGDSTTSVTILSALIFEKLVKFEEEHPEIPPASIVTSFKKCVESIKEEIKKSGRPATIEDMYNIALISTNGNEELSKEIKVIYENFGLDVYIDVKASLNGTSYIKEIDGMVIESGVIDNTFCNNSANESELSKPMIYAFQDPIDTVEMAAYFDFIIMKNIINPLFKEKNYDNVIPTVILTPRISRDLSAFMDQIVQYNTQVKTNQRVPLNIITDITESDNYYDICDLCGCKYIKKYIDADLYKRDVENGLAATPDNIDIMAGTADVVRSDMNKTIFVRPCKMYDEDDNTKYSELFNQRLEFLQGQIDKLTNEGSNVTDTYKLKKRLNSLKGNMVEVYIGGITVADRDQARDLMEDAVLNCRSASRNGVGFGANFEGLIASKYVATLENTKIIPNNDSNSHIHELLCNIISESYEDIYRLLLLSRFDKNNINEIYNQSIKNRLPIDLRNNDGCLSDKVLSSIDTDICVLDSISKIITIMATSNQMVLPILNTNLY